MHDASLLHPDGVRYGTDKSFSHVDHYSVKHVILIIASVRPSINL